MNKYWQVNNKAGSRRAEILIYEQIGKNWWDGSGVGAKDFITDLNGLDVDDIDIRINSLGGSVFEGTAIYNGLKAHKANIHVKIDGIAASIASVIAMAGDDIEIPENGMIMIHDPWMYAGGNADDMRAAADMLDKVKVGILSAYRGKTGKEDSALAEMMSAETWMTAKEAIEHGFADKMTGAIEAQANYDQEVLGRFRRVPGSLLNAGVSGAKSSAMEVHNMAEKTPAKPEITLELIRAEYPDIAKALIEEGNSAGIEEGAKAENSRIKDVLAQSLPGHEAIINELAFDGKTSGPEAAVVVLQAENKLRAATLTGLQNGAPPVVQQSAGDVPQQMTEDEKLKAEWDKSAELRAEFADSFESYAAYSKEIPGIKVKTIHTRG